MIIFFWHFIYKAALVFRTPCTPGGPDGHYFQRKFDDKRKKLISVALWVHYCFMTLTFYTYTIPQKRNWTFMSTQRVLQSYYIGMRNTPGTCSVFHKSLIVRQIQMHWNLITIIIMVYLLTEVIIIWIYLKTLYYMSSKQIAPLCTRLMQLFYYQLHCPRRKNLWQIFFFDRI